jgi:hypothetical protein
MKIPIKALKELASKYGYDHVICFATEGKEQYVATYGRTIQECDQAAQFGDMMKDALGWPERLHAAPSRVRSLQKQVKLLQNQLSTLLEAARESPTSEMEYPEVCDCGQPFPKSGKCEFCGAHARHPHE